MTVDIQQATMENKTATITVTRKDNGVVTVYTVKFIADSSQNPTTEPAPDRMIYASDLKPLWETTYPNHRGLDGKNERFMADKGWVNPGDINNPNLTKRRSWPALVWTASRERMPRASRCMRSPTTVCPLRARSIRSAITRPAGRR